MAAEIVCWSSQKSTRVLTGREAGPEVLEVREKVSVRTHGRLDVHALRDLVSALEGTKIPGRTEVKAVMQEDRVIQLTVEAELEPPPQVGGSGGAVEGGQPE